MNWILRKQNKYKAVKQVYNDVKYDSGKEAGYAAELTMLKKAGEIKDFIPHFKLDIRINDEHICNYFVDFKVINNDGSEELHEVKSYITMTPVWRLKWRMTEVIYGDHYKLVVIK